MLTLSYLSEAPLDLEVIDSQWRESITQEQVGELWRIDINVQPDDSSYRYLRLMTKPQLTLKFSWPFYFEFPVGTWCVFQNQRFILTRAEDLTRKGNRIMEYSMTLGTQEDFFGMWKLRNVVDAVSDEAGAPKDNRLKFSLTAKPHEFIELIVRNLKKKDTSIEWETGDTIASDEKTVEFNHAYIDAALNDIAAVFETEYEVEYIGTSKAKIHLRRVEYFKDAPIALSYGIGNGFIPGVGRTSEADGVPVKRMFVQGSDRNIDRSKYGSPELLLPKSQTIRYDGTCFEGEPGFNAEIARTYASNADGEYVERIDKISKSTREDSLDCSEIYPSRVGTVTSVIVANEDKNFYDFIDNTIPDNLDFSKCLIAGEEMTVVFQSGMLAGREFDVKYKHDERKFQIVPQEIDGIMMPGDVFVPKAGATPEDGDKYAVFGVQLPEAYICDDDTKTGGSWDMMRAAVKALYENEEQKFTFKGVLQGLWAKRHWLDIGGKLVIGGHVLFTDPEFAPDGAVIRIIGIKDYITKPYSPTIELSNGVTAGNSSVAEQIRQITNTEVAIGDAEHRAIAFTKRRFRDAKQTIEMLEDAQLDNFTGAISPVAVQAMALLLGDESLQFRLVNIESDENGKYSYTDRRDLISFSTEKRQLFCNMHPGETQIYLQHLTIGQNAITTEVGRNGAIYKTWAMESFATPELTDPLKTYFLYARVSIADTTELGSFFIDSMAHAMDSEDGYYTLLVGVLNAEINGERSFVSLYGFTEILPGRITTDVITSADGQTYFDLVNGVIKGKFEFLSDDGYITIIDGGKIRSELIDVTNIIARSVIVGDENGRHVRIEPDAADAGSVRIFDDNRDECTVLEGKSYGGINELYSDETGGSIAMKLRKQQSYGYATGVTLGRGKDNVRALLELDVPGSSKIAHKEDTIIISDILHTATPTEVRIKAGHLRAQTTAGGFEYTHGGNSIDNVFPTSRAWAEIHLRLESYESYDEETGELSNLIGMCELGKATSSAAVGLQAKPDPDIGSVLPGPGTIETTTLYPDVNHTSELVNVANTGYNGQRVPAGYHCLVIQYVLTAIHVGSHATIDWGFTNGARSDIAAEWLCEFYVSRYFANGYCLGTRRDNYIMAHKTPNGMEFVMENGAHGFRFSSAGLQYKKGSDWKNLV